MNVRYLIGVTAAATLLALASGCAAKHAPAPSTTAPASSSAATPPLSPSIPPSNAVPVQKPVAPENNPPGDIPDNQAFVSFKTAGGVSLKIPEGWSRRSTNNSVEFTDKLNTVRVSWSVAAQAPTVANVKAVEVPQLESQELAFQLVRVRSVPLPVGPAVLAEYRVNSTANPVTGKQYRLDVQRYSVSKNGERVDLTLLSPVGADNVDPWRIVSQSLSWK